MTRCTTPSPTFCPTGAPRVCIARWCAIKKIAAYAAGFSGFPGNKYSHLFAFYAVPIPGHTNGRIAESASRVEIQKLKTQDVTDEELQMFKTRTKADLIRGLASNEGLARTAGLLSDALRRLARVVSLPRSRGQGDQGRHSPRREPGVSRTTTAPSASSRRRPRRATREPRPPAKERNSNELPERT